MANERVASLRLRFQTTAQDIQRARTDVRSLITDIDALEAQQDSLNATYARSMQTQIANARSLDQNDAFVNALRTDLGALADAQDVANRSTNEGVGLLDRYRRAVEMTTEAEQRRQGSVSGRTAGRLEQVDRFGRVGTQILSGLGQGEAANAVGLVGDVADSFTRLNPVMLGVTAATTGLALVYGHLRQETQRVTDLTTARINAETELARFLATATTTQVRERIEQTRESLRTEEAILDARRREEAEARGALNAFDALRLSLGIAYGEITAMTTATDNQATVVEGLRTDLDGLTDSFQNLDPVLGIIYGQIEAFNDLRDTMQYVNQLLYDQKQAQLQEAAARAEDLHQTEQYTANLLYEAKVRQELNRQRGLSDATDQLFKLNEQLVDLDNKDREAAEALAKARQDASDKLLALDAEAEAERSRNIADAGKQRTKIIADSEERILDITRKGNAMLANAIGGRDALAFYLAKQNQKEQLADEQKAAAKRLQELQDNLADQNRTVDQRLQERRRIEETRAREEIALRLQAAQQTLTALDNALNAQFALQQQYYILAGQEAYNGGANLVAQFKAGMTASFSRTAALDSNNKGYFYTAQQFTGTLAPATNTPFQFNNTNGGATLNLSLNGMGKQEMNNLSYQQAVQVTTDAVKQLYGVSSPR